jgi:hypothetical protein
MKRVLFGMLVAVLSTGVAATAAEAQKKKPAAAAKKKKTEPAPQSAKISETMGDVHWGLGKEELIKHFTDKVKEKYRPLLAKTKDAVQEDKLRQKARAEIDAIKKGAVDFDGRASNWDVSYLKGEFTNGNDESMVVVRDENSQNFYFLIGGKLWKWYKAFDASVFPAGNFDAFAASVQRKFGNGKDVQGEARPGEGKRHWIEWQDKTTRLRAVDESGFYGFYCLVFEDKGTVDQLARLRSRGDKNEGGEKHHALVEAVTSGNDKANPDESPNIADRITGRMHQQEHAPQQQGGEEVSASASGKSAKGKGSGKSGSSSSGSAVDNENDPISGLGL